MSVLQGFAMLNDAIRNVRVDNQRHAEKMAVLDQQKQQMEYQMNDPRQQLARQRAQEELKPTQFDMPNVGKFNNIKDKQHYEMYTKPAITGILDQEGMTLSDKGMPVWKDSNQPVEMPAWKVKTLHNKVSMATIASRFGNSDLDMKIDKLNSQMESQQKSYRRDGTAKEKLEQKSMAEKQTKMNELVAKRTDPNERLKRIMDTNAGLSKMYKAALSDPNMDPAFFDKLNAFHKINNAEAKMLLDNLGEEKGKDFVGVDYHWRHKDTGETITRTTYLPKHMAGMAPNTMNYGDHVFTLGEIKKVGGTTEGGSGFGPGALKEAQKNTVLKDFNKFNVIRDTAKLGKEKLGVVKSRLEASGLEPSEVTKLVKAIEGNEAQVVKHYSDLINNYNLRYGKQDWFTGNAPAPQAGGTASGDFSHDAFKARLEANRKK